MKPGAPARGKLHVWVADELGVAIVRGDFKPGESIPPEMDICQSLGVSRTATREAIRGLVAKGLIESKPKLGSRVRDPANWNHLDLDVLRWRVEATDTETYLVKMFQLRNATEPAAAAIAAMNAQEEDRERLRAGFQVMVDAGEENEGWVEGDLAFHKAIYLATHNEFFWPIGQFFGFSLKQMFGIAAIGAHRPRALGEHRAVLDAIVGGDPDAARAAVQVLLDNAAKDVDRILSDIANGTRLPRGA